MLLVSFFHLLKCIYTQNEKPDSAGHLLMRVGKMETNNEPCDSRPSLSILVSLICSGANFQPHMHILFVRGVEVHAHGYNVECN